MYSYNWIKFCTYLQFEVLVFSFSDIEQICFISNQTQKAPIAVIGIMQNIGPNNWPGQ